MKTPEIILLIVLLVFFMSGCATVAKSPTTFAVCKTVDVASTMYGIHTGKLIEMNPIVKALGYPGLIVLSVALYEIIKAANNPPLTVAANVVTCPVAAHNLVLLTQ
jgi:hypothetical protein